MRSDLDKKGSDMDKKRMSWTKRNEVTWTKRNKVTCPQTNQSNIN